MMNLGNLKRPRVYSAQKIVGRGKGSGMGNRATRGHDGQLGRGSSADLMQALKADKCAVFSRNAVLKSHRIEFAIVNLQS